jgi:hypothetical protein
MGSDVTALLATIEAEYTAGRAALCGMAQGTARHAFITAKMERMEIAQEALIAAVGEEAAKPLIVAVWEAAPS